jgi:hypothetical protein
MKLPFFLHFISPCIFDSRGASVALRENFKTTGRKEQENIRSQEYGGLDGEEERGRIEGRGTYLGLAPFRKQANLKYSSLLVFTSAPGTHVPLVTNKTCESS